MSYFESFFYGYLRFKRFGILRRLSLKPRLYFFLLKFQCLFSGGYHLWQIVERNTDIVIEGYPRSANTFAFQAFEMAQDKPLNIGHHIHMPCQIKMAYEYDIPTLVLIRPPEEAVISWCICGSFITLKDALREYIFFYENVRDYQESFVTATFQQVINNFPSVTEKINKKFNKNYKSFENTEENLQKCFELIDNLDRKKSGKHRIRQMKVCRPVDTREKVKQEFKEELKKPHLQSLLKKASEIFTEFSEHAKL